MTTEKYHTSKMYELYVISMEILLTSCESPLRIHNGI